MPSPSPTPPFSGKNSEDSDGDWRSSVAQPYRSTEVREIAKVLAALEPGATSSSKLMLAMRFEDTIFNTAESLADYRKKLTKRLKKLQKTYVPTAAATTQASKQEQRVLELKQKYGETLRLVVQNSDTAVALMKAKNGNERASHLKQHTDNAKEWYAELLGEKSATKPMDVAKLDKIEKLLEQRLDNIRSHVIKLTDPDNFLKETLEKLEDDMQDSTSKILAAATSRRLSRMGWSELVEAERALSVALEQAQVPTPLPTRNQNTDRKAGILHLEKMRAASQAVLAFTSVPDKAAAGLPRSVLGKCHDVIMNGLEFVAEVIPKLSGEHDRDKGVTLEDAWTKVLELPREDGTLLESQTSKRLKTNHQASPIVKSRVLLAHGRKPPSSMLPALKQKRAKLVRPSPTGLGSHLVMAFEDAFVMTVYLAPLIVTMRAAESATVETSSPIDWIPTSSGLRHLSEVEVFGVKGSPEAIGRVVEHRLRYASAHATNVLRQCFCSTLKAKNDYEVEILEVTALLQFLQLCRDTYMPGFQGDDVGF